MLVWVTNIVNDWYLDPCMDLWKWEAASYQQSWEWAPGLSKNMGPVSEQMYEAPGSEQRNGASGSAQKVQAPWLRTGTGPRGWANVRVSGLRIEPRVWSRSTLTHMEPFLGALIIQREIFLGRIREIWQQECGHSLKLVSREARYFERISIE